MPIIFVYGLPLTVKQPELEKFCDELREETCSVPELKLVKDQVSAFFPPDLMNTGLGEEIIMFVEGLFDKPEERTEDVRKTLAEKLAACGRKFFPDANLVECFVKPFDPRYGFASDAKT